MEQFGEISLKRLMEIFMASISFIVVVTLVVGIVAFVYSETMIVPEYESTVTLLVNNDSGQQGDKIQGADITASKMLVETYIIIIKSDTVLSRVCQELEKEDIQGYTPKTLRNVLTASAKNDTEIFDVTIRGVDPEQTFVIANIIADVAPPIIQDLLEASSVRVVDYATKGIRVSPNIQRNTIIGLFIGLLLSCGFVVLREVFDMRVKSEEDLERWFGLPILGVVPDIQSPHNTRNGYYYYRRGTSQYEYRKEERQYARKSAGKNERISKNTSNSK